MKKIATRLMILGCATAWALGCASSAPQAKFSQTIVPESRITAQDQAKVMIDAGPGVSILQSEKARLAETIEHKIAGRQSASPRRNGGKSFDVEVLLTRYEKGNAFARAMLPGLGQIHLDADVKLLELPARNQVGAFTVRKTFAWGGLYGATTSMEDIEQAFADGVAAAITGQKEGNQ